MAKRGLVLYLSYFYGVGFVAYLIMKNYFTYKDQDISHYFPEVNDKLPTTSRIRLMGERSNIEDNINDKIEEKDGGGYM
jgi:hypothetical protein